MELAAAVPDGVPPYWTEDPETDEFPPEVGRVALEGVAGLPEKLEEEEPTDEDREEPEEEEEDEEDREELEEDPGLPVKLDAEEPTCVLPDPP